MKLKVIGLVAALVLAAPVAAIAAPASGLTAQSYVDLTNAPMVASDAAVAPGDAAPKIEKVWWRGGFGWRGGFYGRRFGFYRRPFFGYYRRPFFGFYRRPFFRRRFFF